MAEGTEIDERVDFEEENYMEEMEDDIDEQVDEDNVDEGGDRDGRENIEKKDEDRKPDVGDVEKVMEEEGRGNEGAESEPVKDQGEPVAPISEADKEKFAELLALPPHGSEVFIGGLPRDTSEEDLRDLCEPIGEVFEVRIVKDKDTGESKGYAFIVFKMKEFAQQAIEDLHSKEFKGKTLRCSLSESKNRLFIGNIPKGLTDDDFRKVLAEVCPGIENIELIKDPQNPARNRGFAFVLYYNNACADYSRQKLSNSDFKLDGNTPSISWADPKITPDSSAAASQVKALYVKNIPENTTTDQLKELFQRHGEVTKVVMPPSRSGSGKRDFGFIHYAERTSALKAIKDAEKYEIDGQALEVVLAKPQADRKTDGAYPYSSGHHSNHISHPGYGGFVPNPYGSTGGAYGVAAGYQQQPVIYGRGPMPAGMQMVPMVLPDGRVGYVLQQPGMQMSPPRPRRSSNGPRGHSGRGGSGGDGDESKYGRRHRPY